MNNTRKSTHLAVAPIIATLLMVAIAVVGGILIFVFTQGFFADDQVVGPKVDSLYTSGYNAEDATSEDLTSSGGTPLTCPNAKQDGFLSSGDCLLLFVQNRGPDPLSIGEVRVYGTSYSPSTNSTLDDSPAGGPICDDGKSVGSNSVDIAEFRVYDENASLDLLIEPNESSSICVTYFGNNVKPGKVIPVQIVTTNGQILLENVRNGATRTAETGTFASLGGAGEPTEPPILVVNAAATANDNEINVTWNLVDDQGNPTTYTITRSSGGVNTGSVDLQQYLDSDTPCGTAITYTVTASNSASGNTPNDESDSVQDTGVAPTPPSTLTDPTSSASNGNGNLNVQWANDAFDGNCAGSYTFAVTGTGGNGEDSTTDDQNHTITGLSDGDAFSVSITVSNDFNTPAPIVFAGTYDMDCSVSAAPAFSSRGAPDTGSTVVYTHTPDAGCGTTYLLEAENTSKGGGYQTVGSALSTAGVNFCTVGTGSDGDSGDNMNLRMTQTPSEDGGAKVSGVTAFTLSNACD